MIEYKVIRTTVKEAEAELNRLAAEGWQVASTAAISGMSMTVNSTPLIVTLEREAR